ncbi:hydroxyisourate hydrolase [Streptomyces sp. SID13031]|uniref:hydroxyisourate hydrolase n=1 Tax=Streptomyces sp. SID13031 TaxID=2706046 RepID=UPI0013C999F9|nr:hydroxyisourate hydrolase [Streptomyces sp. SID13031]NEA30275.1 hydroxyisourate hydrolase [Streptomyces sp. SID13031]
MSTVSTHILDTALGKPAPGVTVQLSSITPPEVVGSNTTDQDGRISEFTAEALAPGTYQLRFDVAAYGRASGQEFFFPEVTVTFLITDERHYHVPLLLSPFAFSTYRGS